MKNSRARHPLKKTFKNLYQFKVTLEDVFPPIWRQILVPEAYSFWDLHVAIQDAMGWMDCHLHNFETRNPVTGASELIGIPPDEPEGVMNELPGWNFYIKDYFTKDNRIMVYSYDYGDGWEHRVEFEGILLKKPDVRYPICIAGERSCPPEDCGGPYGYNRLLKILKDCKHPGYKTMKDWIREDFNSEEFDPKKVLFDNPKDRWDNTFPS